MKTELLLVKISNHENNVFRVHKLFDRLRIKVEKQKRKQRNKYQ
jgi:hypothetical protein